MRTCFERRGFRVPIGLLDEGRSLGLRLAFMARLQWVQHEKADLHVFASFGMEVRLGYLERPSMKR